MQEIEREFERHPDPVDTASDVEARIVKDGIESALRITGPAPTGFCLNPRCEDQLVTDEALSAIRQSGEVPADTRRWCDARCRDEWQLDQKQSKYKGVQ